MQPIKIVIPGKFYDSFIYNKNLILWDINGDIIKIDWDFFIIDFFENYDDKFAYYCSFIHGDYLYGNRWELIFEDVLIKDAIKKRFEKAENITLDVKDINKRCKKSHNPFPFPHSDCVIYRKYERNPDLYISTSKGLFKSPYYVHKNGNLFNLLEKSTKCHDIPSFNIEVQSNLVVSSCGDEGVFGWSTEFDLSEIQLSNKHSTWVSWSFSDIFSSSYYNGGYLLESSLNRRDNDDRFSKRHFSIIEKFSVDNLFKKKGLTWGVDDKICSLHDGEIEIYQYKRNTNDGEEKFIKLESFYDERLSLDNIIKTGSAPWGYILEYKTMLLVIQSDGKLIKIEHNGQEIVNWRIFTRSIRYSNQLHVIFEDNISIYSFSNDYFQDQFKKNIGIRFIPISTHYKY